MVEARGSLRNLDDSNRSGGKGKKKKSGCCGGGTITPPPPRPPPQDNDRYKVSKVIFMGDRAVGKTSIIQALVENKKQN